MKILLLIKVKEKTKENTKFKELMNLNCLIMDLLYLIMNSILHMEAKINH